ncbi:MAG: hypothetical protein HPY53_11155 [Brevinematales bacterium]|nr:hypothetical protein [Brevinematales bacterium]
MAWFKNISISFFCFAVVNMASGQSGSVEKVFGQLTDVAEKTKSFIINVVLGLISVAALVWGLWEAIQVSRGKSQRGWGAAIALFVVAIAAGSGAALL